MRLVFLGTGSFGRPTLRWLAESGHEVSLVVTQPARPSGRGRRTGRTPIRAMADELNLEVLDAADVSEQSVVETLRSLDAALAIVIDFGQKLGEELLSSFPSGCINLHPSLLPKFRGAAPINWAIIRGEERTGCTVFRLTQRMDAGPILASRWTYIKPDETAGELHDRLTGIGVDAVRAALELYEQNALPGGSIQDSESASRAPKLAKSDGEIEFDRPAREVANHICGVTPWPGARARFQSKDSRWEDVAILRARPAEDRSVPTVLPGAIDARRYVAAQDGFIEILEVKPSSGRSMTWQDFVNGRHVSEGDTFSPRRQQQDT